MTFKIIAEVKPQSPFDPDLHGSWESLFDVAEQVGDTIAIHTSSEYGGSFDHIRRARQLTKKPILAKGIHRTDDDVKRAFGSGADWVLVVGRLTNILPGKCLFEPNTIEELMRYYPQHYRVVWNARDLANNGEPKKESFLQARIAFSGWLCQASFIRTIHDVDPQAQAVLVGTHLREFAASLPRN